ncbi:MAG: hypothetical protein K2Q12_08860, partial [Rickettsiales bacterium]|nr:hypothetical protein [Rickettsiales bacterium]
MESVNYDSAMDSNQAEPLHTGVTKDPASTPGYFRMLLAALPARYGLRAMINFAQEMPPVRWLDEHVLRMPEKMKIFDNFLHKKAGALPLEEITRKARFYDPKMTQQKLENWQGNSSQLTEGLPGFRDKVRDATLASHYDNLLGAGSLAVTGMYAMRVNSDIWHTFAETVAFETGKNPKDVTIRDLYASDNRIVQSTMRNFFSKTLTRLATDVIFFGRQLAHLPHAP